jgi:hypothetical protein
VSDDAMANVELTNRALRPLTEAEIKLSLQAPRSEQQICEWETANLTYFLNSKKLTLIATNAMGGDRFEVLWGCLYHDIFAALADWREIQYVASAYKVDRRERP